MADERKVLCGANAYEQKYYFNEAEFSNLPNAIKEELNIICVLFTEEVGGIFTIVIESDGSVSLETQSEDDDFYYDEISSGLLINQVRQKRKELFESISMYYRVFFLHETFEDVNTDEN